MDHILVLSVGGNISELGLNVEPSMAPSPGSESDKEMRNVER